MLRGLRQIIRENRQQTVFRKLAAASEKYLRAWHNDGFFEFDGNGERFALEAYASWKGAAPLDIWDVGAHFGEWASTCHRILPNAHVTSFEILKSIFEKIAEKAEGADWWDVLNSGLSDSNGVVEVTWNRSDDSTNSINPRLTNRWFANADLEKVQCQVTTIDDLLRSGRRAPSLLKIDVEGHEKAVLMGGRELLSGSDAPEMIQFEYGDTWIPARAFLMDVHSLLEGCGYSIGRLHPNHVNFKSYAFEDESFRMGNMIAVKSPDLKAKLAASHR